MHLALVRRIGRREGHPAPEEGRLDVRDKAAQHSPLVIDAQGASKLLATGGGPRDDAPAAEQTAVCDCTRGGVTAPPLGHAVSEGQLVTELQRSEAVCTALVPLREDGVDERRAQGVPERSGALSARESLLGTRAPRRDRQVSTRGLCDWRWARRGWWDGIHGVSCLVLDEEGGIQPHVHLASVRPQRRRERRHRVISPDVERRLRHAGFKSPRSKSSSCPGRRVPREDL